MLRDYASGGHPQALEALRGWHNQVEQASWKSFRDVKLEYPSVDAVGDRLVFNILGNRYRLICRVNYTHGLVFTKWVGTHAEYDRIDVRTVEL
jgi:mRNA interferase HigB